MEQTAKQNTRSITLPLIGGGEILCNFKTPKLKLVREFRELSRAIAFNTDGYQEHYQKGTLAAEAVTALKLQRDELTDAEQIAALDKEIAKGEAHIAAIEAKCQELEALSHERLCKRAWLIVKPEREVTDRPVIFDDIDWPEADIDQINQSVDFFIGVFSGKTRFTTN